MDYSHDATRYRTALLLGMVKGDAVHRWAEEVIARDPDPPHALFEVVSVTRHDLTALRDALWPLVIDPEPPAVLNALFGQLHVELASGRRSLSDTLTILRQMRSMLRLPRAIYGELNATLVDYAAADSSAPIEQWLRRFERP